VNTIDYKYSQNTNLSVGCRDRVAEINYLNHDMVY